MFTARQKSYVGVNEVSWHGLGEEACVEMYLIGVASLPLTTEAEGGTNLPVTALGGLCRCSGWPVRSSFLLVSRQPCT